MALKNHCFVRSITLGSNFLLGLSVLVIYHPSNVIIYIDGFETKHVTG